MPFRHGRLFALRRPPQAKEITRRKACQFASVPFPQRSRTLTTSEDQAPVKAKSASSNAR
jgi:hypothetical protein